MELRAYWSIVRARWWLVVALAIAALAVSAVYTPRASASFRASVRLAVRPQMDALTSAYGEYYQYVASEYLNDDVGKIVESNSFLAELQDRAAGDNGHRPAGVFEVKKAHRLMTIDATSTSRDDALTLATLSAEMLAEPGSRYFARLSSQNPEVTIVDPPAITGSTAPSRVGLDIAIRTILGLLLGVALCFLLDYLDDSIRDRADLEERLGLEVVGEIPRG